MDCDVKKNALVNSFAKAGNTFAKQNNPFMSLSFPDIKSSFDCPFLLFLFTY